MIKNVGRAEGILRVILAATISTLFITGIVKGIAGNILLIAGGYLLVTGVVKVCPIKKLLSKNKN